MDFILEKFIGAVFILAGTHRIYLKNEREHEINNILHLPKYTDYLIIMIEIICGSVLFFNLPYKYESLLLLLFMTTLGTSLLIINNTPAIINTYKDSFTLKENSLSVLVHLTYIVLMYYLVQKLNIK
jgi:hypothetical protein